MVSKRAGPCPNESLFSTQVEDDELAMSAMVAPACPAGGVIIFDYRTLQCVRQLTQHAHIKASSQTRISQAHGSTHAPVGWDGCSSGDRARSVCEHSRGLPNAGTRDRPISYGVCSTGWARDTVNYPHMSCETLSGQLSTDPFDLQASRRAYREAHSFWNDEGNGPSE